MNPVRGPSVGKHIMGSSPRSLRETHMGKNGPRSLRRLVIMRDLLHGTIVIIARPIARYESNCSVLEVKSRVNLQVFGHLD